MLPAEVPLSIDRTELIRSRWLRDQRLTWGIVYIAISITLDTLTSVDVTELTMEVDLSVNVPLVGHTIEEKAMSLTDRAIADEKARATAWLAEH